MGRKPNILLLLSDEHHYGVSGYAGDPVVQTGALDRLAADGVSFANTHCQSPVCTPSRMSFLCGKNVWNCGAWNNHWTLAPEHRTVADHFSDAGYATCLVGKMHFGGKDQHHGFGRRPYGDFHHGLGHQPDPIDMFPNSGGVGYAGVSQIPESLQQEPIVSLEAAAWVEEHCAAEPEQPWFMCASYCKPHAPLVCPSRYLERYRGRVPSVELEADDEAALHPYPTTQRENYAMAELSREQHDLGRAAYWGCVDFLDDCIGMLLWRLEQAGALEDTIIVYTSDHGDMIGNHGLWWKAIFYEEAVRVPFLIAGPGIPRGVRRDELAALTDLYPTLCALAGLPAPKGIDGVDLSPLLTDGPAEPPRDHIISAFYGCASMTQRFRSGAKGNSMRLIRTERYKYVNTFEQGDLFFDLQDDPREFHNRIDDPACADEIATLRARLNDGFSWELALERIDADRERLAEFRSGVKPTTPNQYELADGRRFDAEAALYDARWLQTELDGMSGIIPQMYH